MFAGTAFLFSAVAYRKWPEMTRGVSTASGSTSIDAFAVGCFALTMGIFFLRVRAYRPDIPANDSDRKSRSWWTGEVI